MINVQEIDNTTSIFMSNDTKYYKESKTAFQNVAKHFFDSLNEKGN